jgi:hypothetical protein
VNPAPRSSASLQLHDRTVADALVIPFSVIMIGYARSERRGMLGPMTFAGHGSNHDLPAYLPHRAVPVTTEGSYEQDSRCEPACIDFDCRQACGQCRILRRHDF